MGAPLDIVAFQLGKQQGGGSAELEEKTVSVTANGTTEIEPSAGKDGMSKVTLIVALPTYDGTVV